MRTNVLWLVQVTFLKSLCVTLSYFASLCVTLRYFALLCVTLRCFALLCVTLRNLVGALITALLQVLNYQGALKYWPFLRFFKGCV